MYLYYKLLVLIMLGILAVSDIRRRAVPPLVYIPAVLLCCALRLQGGELWQRLPGMLAGGLGMLVVWFAIYVSARGRLGGGDVKVFAVLGFLCGFDETMIIALASMTLALIYGLISGNRQKIPLIPFAFFAYMPIAWGIDVIIANMIKSLL